MGYNCGDCESQEFACTAWDGNGSNKKPMNDQKMLNHNFVPTCPLKVESCQFRIKKTPSNHPLFARK